ncbi:MAG: YdcF family protein, partial [Planctomycetota bacterium]|nr:YdcF family protein [Planctomycetota bacterium]
LYNDHYAPKIIVSSRGPDVEHYARIMALFGVPEAAIIRDRSAARTADHPAGVAALPGVDPETTRLILVTSLYHTARARACFVHAGYKRLVMRAPAVQMYQRDELGSNWAWRYRCLPGWGRELVGWGLYKLRGWL